GRIRIVAEPRAHARAAARRAGRAALPAVVAGERKSDRRGGRGVHRRARRPHLDPEAAEIPRQVAEGPAREVRGRRAPRARTLAHAFARPKSTVTPAPPCAWIASSRIASAMFGAFTLIIAISARATLLPTVSIMWAAFSVSSREHSISIRAFAIRSSQSECS